MNDQDLIEESLKAERALLGSLLLDREAVAAVAGKVPSEAFCKGRHRVVWTAAIRLWDRREPIDLLTLPAEVRAMGVGEDRLPAAEFADLLTAVPTAVHAEWYGARVVKLARRRAIAKSGSALVMAAYGDDEDADTGELIATIRDAVAPFEPSGEDATLRFGPAAEHAVYGALADWSGESSDRLIPTGIAKLDRVLGGGLRRKQLVIIGARPGMGKSALMVQIGLATKSHLVSLEMSRDEITRRMIAQIANVPYSIGHDPIGDVALRARWLDAAASADAYPVTITDRPQTTHQIETDAARLVAEHGVQVVVIDHLDWLADKIRTEDLNAKTAALVRRCKAIAKECDVAVIALAQLNRNVEHRAGFLPYLSDFRNSGAVEQDADVAIMLYRRRYYSERGMLEPDSDEDYFVGSDLQKTDLIVAKNRNGATGSVLLGWEPKSMKFHERNSA